MTSQKSPALPNTTYRVKHVQRTFLSCTVAGLWRWPPPRVSALVRQRKRTRIYTRLYQDSCSYLCVPPPCYAVRIKDGCGASLLAIGVPVHSVHGEPKWGRGWSEVKVKRRSLFYKRAGTRTVRPEVWRTQISVLWYIVEFCCWIKSCKILLISDLLKESYWDISAALQPRSSTEIVKELSVLSR